MTTLLTAGELTRVQKLIEQICTDSSLTLDVDTSLEIFASAAWSGVGEPGDAVVRMLCDELGKAEALSAVLLSASPADIARRLSSSKQDIDEIDVTASIGEALERWRPRLSKTEAIAHLERAQRIKAHLITEQSELWPVGLNDLGAHSPIALWVRGKPETLAALDRSISVVGARASTGYGEHVTMEIVSQLTEAGYATVSGAAYGIDGMAHRAALASSGTTIAVLAGGIDRLYPSGHDALLQRIIEMGAVITELPCGFAPTKWRFLQRNRLIAAMSGATVVVEAGWRSGSLNTAHHALEIDRPVGVIPGPITSASSAGCHRLLRETPAELVTTAQEIIQLAGGVSTVAVEYEPSEATHPFAPRVLDAMSIRKGRQPEELAKSSGLSHAETLAVLGLLEITGAVREVPTGWIKQSA